MRSLLQAAIALMIAGAITAGATDLSYSLPGYVYVAICAVSTAVYLILIRFIRERTGVPLARPSLQAHQQRHPRRVPACSTEFQLGACSGWQPPGSAAAPCALRQQMAGPSHTRVPAQ